MSACPLTDLAWVEIKLGTKAERPDMRVRGYDTPLMACQMLGS